MRRQEPAGARCNAVVLVTLTAAILTTCRHVMYPGSTTTNASGQRIVGASLPSAASRPVHMDLPRSSVAAARTEYQRHLRPHSLSPSFPREKATRVPRTFPPLRATTATQQRVVTESTPALPSVATGGEMATQYNFKDVEEELYKWWELKGYFKPEINEQKEEEGGESDGKSNKKSYVIPMPPPNVTGYLHMGHALFVAVQDILARFHRMLGEPTLWLPGTDHAGIATQLLVERDLATQNLTRQGIGREAFLERVWSWKQEKGGYITDQMKRLGASADWDRQKFTLDADLSKAVTEAFVRLHEKGLIYRGDRMVNWSPNLQTAVSDLEVEYEDRPNAKLYTFKYPLADGEGDYIPVATTRPETILGDTAVCVHPEDERYVSLVGREVVVPGSGRRIPVISDEYVDMEFGTGALKITPSHDPNDYELGRKHGLKFINVMNKDATMNANADEYAGLDRYECRKKLWADMEEEGLTLNVTKHETRVPISQRGGEMIEPMVSTQWFVKAGGMAEKSLEAVRSEKIKFVPPRFEKMWDYWLENIQDWCISRQLWWGHRIPVWHVVKEDGSLLSDDASVQNSAESLPGYVVARDESEAYEIARRDYGEQVKLSQDEDVLDTWFSSGLWPFATVGWPDTSNPDFKRYYPAAILETGYDILFFWVARMVMMGLELTEEPPFETIYLHGLVRDAKGKKMSKTTGNVIDPLETIDQYGADALRFSLVTGGAPGQDVPLSMEKVEGNRNFANKLWNAGRYLIQMMEREERNRGAGSISDFAVRGPMTKEELESLPLAEKYIVSKAHDLVEKVTSALHQHKIGEAGSLAYDFFWNQYTAWYIEASKVHMEREGPESENLRLASLKTLVYVFDTCLRVLHPFMPYVTETLWQRLPHHGDALIISPWPQMSLTESLPRSTEAEENFGLLQDVVNSIRSARAEYKVEPGKRIGAVIRVAESTNLKPLVEESDVLAFIGRVEKDSLEISNFEKTSDSDGNTVKLVVREGLEVLLPMKQMVDVEKERQRLEKQAEKIQKDVDLLEKRLQSKGFVDKAPPAKVEETRQQLNERKSRLATIKTTLENLE